MAGQVVYLFDEGTPESLSPAVRGGKGAGLAELARMGMPVPPGFTITTSVARAFMQEGRLPKRIEWQIDRCLSEVEKAQARVFGSKANPLLVSVRSGAAVSMPGTMDTILNVGLNAGTVEGMSALLGERFAYDSYRRFMALFGQTVLDVDRQLFKTSLDEWKALEDVEDETQLSLYAIQALCEEYAKIIKREAHREIPDDPFEQLALSMFAVIKSWHSAPATEYRRKKGIPDWWGTGVNVQSMVFGNMDNDSGTGVVFSRDPSTGRPGLCGEFLMNAQGEEIVAGIRTPMPISEMRDWNRAVFDELQDNVMTLEDKLGRIVDVEFTVESGRLYILQWRAAKLTAAASAAFAVHNVWNGTWNRRQALDFVSPDQVAQLSARTFEISEVSEATHDRLCTRGMAASPGVAVGEAVFSSERALELARQGKTVILVRPDTHPSDLPGMLASAAIVTAEGGTMCHAAVNSREFGIPAVVGCDLNFVGGGAIGFLSIKEGDILSVDGTSGLVFKGALMMVSSSVSREVMYFLRWQKRFVRRKEPQIGFEYMAKLLNPNTMLNDFYLADAMAQAAKGTPLQARAQKLRNEIHVSNAEAFACYLTIACAGELRHATMATDHEARVSFQQLQKDFNLPVEGLRAVAQTNVIDVLKRCHPSRRLQFFELAVKTFMGFSGSSYGGPPWAAIAQACLDFLTGKLTHTVFVDHVFDLKHNGGVLFDKHGMVTAADGYSLNRQLDAKKAAKSFSQLRSSLLAIHNRTSASVQDLLNEGSASNLW